VGFRVLFDQGSRDLAGCSFPSNQVIISFTYLLKHNAPGELIVAHKFNMEAILCFCSSVLLLTNGKYKVLFNQGCLNIQGILPSSKICGNYCSTCGFLVALEHMIGKICQVLI
jgi:hypothetical protein